MKKIALWGLAIVAALFVTAELGVRAAGVVDFPLYDRSAAEIGYLPRPSQHGSFQNKNDWCFNEHSMGVCEPFRRGPGRDILLVGDSVVLGGNPLRQADKLGPQLARATGAKVWPVAAGSWALRNELAYLKAHPEVTQNVDEVVFVLDTGDLWAPARWANESANPTHRPVSALAYVLKKYVIKEKPLLPRADETDATRALDEWREFVSTFHKPIYVALWSSKPEFLNPAQRKRELDDQLAPLGVPGVMMFWVQAAKDWTISDYRDGIHETSHGAAVAAREIAAHL